MQETVGDARPGFVETHSNTLRLLEKMHRHHLCALRLNQIQRTLKAATTSTQLCSRALKQSHVVMIASWEVYLLSCMAGPEIHVGVEKNGSVQYLATKIDASREKTGLLETSCSQQCLFCVEEV